MGIFNNILESFFSGFSGIGQQQQDRRQSESTKGEDIRLDLKLEFREAVFGCEKQIKIVHLENCSICSGSGAKPSTRPRTYIEEKCENCNGSGLNQVTKEMKIIIPAGVDSGTRLRIANEGDAGLHGIPSGDLYIYLFVQPDND